MQLRIEAESDQAAVRDLHLRAFGDHGTVVADLVETLRDTLTMHDGLSLVAVDDDDDELVGQVLFSRSLLDAPKKLVDVQVLSPLAVLPERQGAGIGGALIRRGLEILADQRVPVVFLEGPPLFYSRFGFQTGAGLGFRKPSLRIPDEAFQARLLPTYEPWMSGTLVYAAAFWQHDAVGLRPVLR